MGKAMGMLKELGGRITGDMVLEREGREERFGSRTHHADSVGGRVHEVLDQPFDERHPAHGGGGDVGSAGRAAVIAPLAPASDTIEVAGPPDDDVVGDERPPMI